MISPRLHIQTIEVASGESVRDAHRKDDRPAPRGCALLQRLAGLAEERRHGIAVCPLRADRREDRAAREVDLDPVGSNGLRLTAWSVVW